MDDYEKKFDSYSQDKTVVEMTQAGQARRVKAWLSNRHFHPCAFSPQAQRRKLSLSHSFDDSKPPKIKSLYQIFGTQISIGCYVRIL